MSNTYDTQRFLCDPTVGKLAHYLRMIGYDTASSDSWNSSDVLELALEESRTILTRNSVLARMTLARDVILISEDDPWEQLKAVIRERNLDIDESMVLTRCLLDNSVLQPVDKADVRGKVWPYVYQTQDRFTVCPTCNRVFWPATHVQAMLEKLKAIGLV
jgi:uncharacterized protein with PIN domain